MHHNSKLQSAAGDHIQCVGHVYQATKTMQSTRYKGTDHLQSDVKLELPCRLWLQYNERLVSVKQAIIKRQ